MANTVLAIQRRTYVIVLEKTDLEKILEERNYKEIARFCESKGYIMPAPKTALVHSLSYGRFTDTFFCYNGKKVLRSQICRSEESRWLLGLSLSEYLAEINEFERGHERLVLTYPKALGKLETALGPENLKRVYPN